MAATLPDNIFICNFVNEKILISIKISLSIVCKGPIDNKSSLIQVMAWRRTGDKPSPERVTVQLSDAYMRHQASMS